MSNKKWKSFNQQLDILEKRGLIVEDKSAALDYLERIGYYRLSGYLYPFRKLKDPLPDKKNSQSFRKDEFIEGSRFEDAVKLYVFDKKLRLLALDALERIELSVRVDVAHFLGEKDIHAYENPDLLDGNFSKKIIKRGNHDKTQHEIWLKKYEGALHRARKVPFVSHYKNIYGKLPIWVAIEVWDFGMLSKLFSGMKYKDKSIIGQKYGAVDGNAFAGWMRSFNFIRNVSAHHSRLWNINVLERSALMKEDYWNQLDNARPFYYFCLMQQLMKVICPNSSWSRRLIKLCDSFPDVANKSVDLHDFGIIENWKSWSIWS